MFLSLVLPSSFTRLPILMYLEFVQLLLTLSQNSASVATIARIPYVHRLEDVDFLYANNDLLIWSIVEVGISIVATAAATLRPLVANSCLFPRSNTNNYVVHKRFAGASRTGWSSLADRFARPSHTGGRQYSRDAASEWHSQHTITASVCDEGREPSSKSLEEQPLDWENDQLTATVTAVTWQAELDELGVPKCGIQKTVEISQSSLKK